MIQFNLLPDVKIEYLRARRQKHLVVLVSTVTIIASVAIFVILVGIVFGLQKKTIADLSRDIDAAANQLEATPDLTKMLTVQNQLGALTELHEQKPVVARLFTYIAQATPNEVTISKLNVDFEQETMTIDGEAQSLEVINKYVDTLKFAKYTTKSAPDDQREAFSSVVLSSFGRDTEGASYTITFVFDPVIFSEQEEVTLTVPNIITTRSQTEQPKALFNDSEAE